MTLSGDIDRALADRGPAARRPLAHRSRHVTLRCGRCGFKAASAAKHLDLGEDFGAHTAITLPALRKLGLGTQAGPAPIDDSTNTLIAQDLNLASDSDAILHARTSSGHATCVARTQPDGGIPRNRLKRSSSPRGRNRPRGWQARRWALASAARWGIVCRAGQDAHPTVGIVHHRLRTPSSEAGRSGVDERASDGSDTWSRRTWSSL